MKLETLTVKNTSGETAPAFGCAVISGAGRSEGVDYIEIDKPDSGNGEIVAVGPADIPNNGFGIAYRGAGVRVRYSGSAPSLGDELRATASAWTMAATGEGSGAIAIGNTQSSPANTVQVLMSQDRTRLGLAKLSSALSGGDSSASITNMTALDGDAPSSLPTSADNDNGLSGSTNDYVIISHQGTAWRVDGVISPGSGGGGSDTYQIKLDASGSADYMPNKYTTANLVDDVAGNAPGAGDNQICTLFNDQTNDKFSVYTPREQVGILRTDYAVDVDGVNIVASDWDTTGSFAHVTGDTDPGSESISNSAELVGGDLSVVAYDPVGDSWAAVGSIPQFKLAIATAGGNSSGSGVYSVSSVQEVVGLVTSDPSNANLDTADVASFVQDDILVITHQRNQWDVTANLGNPSKVKIDSGADAEYLIDTYDSHTTTQPNGSNYTQCVVYHDTANDDISIWAASTGAGSTDEKVAVDSGETADYLKNLYAGSVVTSEPSSSTHEECQFYDEGASFSIWSPKGSASNTTPALVFEQISAAPGYTPGSPATYTYSSGNVRLATTTDASSPIEFSASNTTAYWSGQHSIDGTTGSPVKVDVELRGNGQYWILQQDADC